MQEPSAVIALPVYTLNGSAHSALSLQYSERWQIGQRVCDRPIDQQVLRCDKIRPLNLRHVSDVTYEKRHLTFLDSFLSYDSL